MPADAEPFGPEDFARALDVSRETLAHLKLYGSMLQDWNERHNLVSKGSLAAVWRRHFLDSAQLAARIPQTANSLADLGSGAGFPGLVLAEMLRDRPSFHAVLYESVGKKADFLRAVAERLNLSNVVVRQTRVEDAPPEAFDIITARACAPLERLMPYAQRFWGPQTIALFLKGQNVEAELTEARKSWRMGVERHPSMSDASGVILEIRELHRVADKRNRSRR